MIKNSLIIPCYNEAGNIKNLIKGCEKYLEQSQNELILVNNGSEDKTEEVIDHYCKRKNIRKVNVEINKGFGYGIIMGIKAAAGKIIIYTHADTEANPEDVLEGLKVFEATNDHSNNFLIKGNRIERRKNKWSYIDMIISSGLSIVTSILFVKKFYDLHAQPVIFHKKMTKYFENAPLDFMFDIYVYGLAMKLNYKIVRFPVNFNKEKRVYGSGNNDSIMKKFNGILNHLFKLRMLNDSIKKINESNHY